MILYLCKADPNSPINGKPKFIACLGTIECSDKGHRFFPANAAHKKSRKFHASLMDAIPSWADEKRQGYTALYNRSEMDAAMRADAVVQGARL